MDEQHEHPHDHRIAYDDAQSPHDMAHDCEAVARELHLEECPHHGPLASPGSAHHLEPPQVSDDLASRGRDIHLHFH